MIAPLYITSTFTHPPNKLSFNYTYPTYYNVDFYGLFQIKQKEG